MYMVVSLFGESTSLVRLFFTEFSYNVIAEGMYNRKKPRVPHYIPYTVTKSIIGSTQYALL